MKVVLDVNIDDALLLMKGYNRHLASVVTYNKIMEFWSEQGIVPEIDVYADYNEEEES